MTRHWVRSAEVPLGVSAVLLAAGLVARLVGLDRVEPGSPAPAWLWLLDVNRERNLPTAWSVGLLLACAWAAARLAREPGRARPGWLLLTGALVAMAADEGVGLHERADALGRVLAGDALHFAWVIPGGLVAGAVALALLRALQAAPRLLRRRVAAAAALYLGGALAVETVSGVVLDTLGRGVVYALLNTVEEGCEMAGVSLLLAALLLAAPVAAPRDRALPPPEGQVPAPR